MHLKVILSTTTATNINKGDGNEGREQLREEKDRTHRTRYKGEERWWWLNREKKEKKKKKQESGSMCVCLPYAVARHPSHLS